MRFAKYHGLGNDFLVVDLRAASPAEAAAAQDPQHVVRAVRPPVRRRRRRRARGPAVGHRRDARMRVLNSDGSEAEMCGNGIRCVAKELYDRGGAARRHRAARSRPAPGRRVCAIDARAGGVARSVTVRMGAPRLTRGEIPMVGPAGERCIEQPLELPGELARALTCVSMGNPHAVTFVVVARRGVAAREADRARRSSTTRGSRTAPTSSSRT